METLREHGARYAKAVLAASGGNKRQACRMLGITYHTLNGYLGVGVPPAELDEGGVNPIAKRIDERLAIERTRAKLTEAVSILSGLKHSPQSEAQQEELAALADPAASHSVPRACCTRQVTVVIVEAKACPDPDSVHSEDLESESGSEQGADSSGLRASCS